MADTKLQQLAKTDRNPVQETEYQELMKGQGSTGGEYGSIENVPSVQGYVQQQFAAEEPALTSLIDKMGERQQPLDVFTKLEEQAGLPELRGTAKTLSSEIADIEDYIDQIEPDVSARTRESLVTEAQRRGLVASEKKPWIENLTKLGTSLGRISQQIAAESGRVASLTELVMRGEEMGLEPYQLRYSVTVDRNVRLMTGFVQDRELQLDMLWDKLQRTRQLSDQEWELANGLAAEERTYRQKLQSIAAQGGVELSGDESTGSILAMIGATAKEEKAWDREMQEAKEGRLAGDSGGGIMFPTGSQYTQAAPTEDVPLYTPEASLYQTPAPAPVPTPPPLSSFWTL